VTTIEVQTPRGASVTLYARDETTDLATIGSTFRLWDTLHDEYGLADIVTDGVLLDVGAHIGSVCIAFLVDNPRARAVALEPLPENIAVLYDNAERAGVSDRLTVLAGALGTDRIVYGPDTHRYIGNIGGASGEVIEVQRRTLGELLDWCVPLTAMKVDCEGGEWAAFADPRIGEVPLIIGEYHGRGEAALRDALEPTHDVTILSEAGETGTFRAVLR